MPHIWNIRLSQPLPIPENPPNDSLVSILERRRTTRVFGEMSNDELGHLLWITSRQVKTGHDQLGFTLSQRPVPCSGAIHSIHILISNQREQYWSRYDPLTHSLQQLPVKFDTLFADVSTQVLPLQSGELVLLVAEPGMTSAKYLDPSSLVWRDAGVILGILAIASELLDLAFCPLGTTGEPWASSLSEQGLLKGVGMAAIGTRR